MHNSRLALSAIAALAVALAGCGGPDESANQNNGFPTAVSADARKSSGGSTSGGASITATNTTFGGYTTVNVNLGPYANDSVTLYFQCTQNGTTVLTGGSWELHYAIQNQIYGYSYSNGVYTVVYGPMSSAAYTGGAASCTVTANDYSGRKAATIGTASFSISG